jgi:hypothetical protein
VPTELLLAAKTHIDNVIREMSMLGVGRANGEPLSQSMSRLIEAATIDFAEARTEVKRQALQAEANGSSVTHLELLLPVDVADAGERYLAALEEADRHARSARLLTITAPSSHRVLRQWYVRSIVDQLRALERGGTPSEPEPFAAALAAEVDRLSHLEDDAEGLALIQSLNSSLSAATTPDEMASLVVELSARYLGIQTVRVFLATSHGTLRSAAWFSAHRTDPDPYDEFALNADLPGAAVARTRESVFMRSRREIYERFPYLDGYYRDERTLHILPVAVGETTLGLLAMTFRSGQLANDDQLQLVHVLADALAQALARVQGHQADRGGRRVHPASCSGRTSHHRLLHTRASQSTPEPWRRGSRRAKVVPRVGVASDPFRLAGLEGMERDVVFPNRPDHVDHSSTDRGRVRGVVCGIRPKTIDAFSTPRRRSSMAPSV